MNLYNEVSLRLLEQLLPYFPDFPFNPKDVRHIGSPIDLIVFDGLSDEKLERILFVEVKTGSSASLTTRERMIKKVIEDHRVEWKELFIERNA